MPMHPTVLTSDAAIDAPTLDRLRELDPTGRAGIVEKVLRTYADSLGKLMGQFDAGRAAGDEVALRHVAHTLRSSSASVGALALSEACAEVEHHIRQQQGPGLAPKLDRLRAEADRAALGVAALLPQGSTA